MEKQTNEEYHSFSLAIPSISKSGLDLINQSPAVFKQQAIDGLRPPPGRALIIGSAFHAMVLEPELFEAEYAVSPRVDRRTKVGKQMWAEFIEAHPGKTHLTEQEARGLQRMQDAVMSHDLASTILNLDGEAEKPIYWRDPKLDVLCKCKPDWLTSDGIVVDVKTTGVPIDQWWKSAIKFRYHVQDAWYSRGVEQMLGIENPRFLFIVVEKGDYGPNHVGVFELASEPREEGARLADANLATFANCIETNQWPGTYDTQQLPMVIAYPSWAYQTTPDRSTGSEQMD